jgi:hypothetical protein
MTVQACNKGSFFEIYKQGQSGSTVKKICIGNTCIGGDGYVKSTNFPICIGVAPNTTNSSTNTTQNNNQTNTTNSTCVSNMLMTPASCTGGNITQESKSGTCKTVICTNGASSMKILACNKPDNGLQYFEMYRQSQNGTAIKKICIGTTCISTDGYVKSKNYPVC